MFNDDNDDIEIAVSICRVSASIAGLSGGIVSLFKNPFFAEAGFWNGLMAHNLVALGTATGEAVCAIPGMIGGWVLGFVATKALEATSKTYGARSGVIVGAALGTAISGYWGGITGYHVSSQMLNQGVASFQKAAVETVAPAIQSPIHVAVKNGKSVVTLITLHP